MQVLSAIPLSQKWAKHARWKPLLDFGQFGWLYCIASCASNATFPTWQQCRVKNEYERPVATLKHAPRSLCYIVLELVLPVNVQCRTANLAPLVKNMQECFWEPPLAVAQHTARYIKRNWNHQMKKNGIKYTCKIRATIFRARDIHGNFSTMCVYRVKYSENVPHLCRVIGMCSVRKFHWLVLFGLS